MDSDAASRDDLPFERLRDPTRSVTFWCNGEPVEDDIRISELCQYCPNEECPGTFEASSDIACKTLKKWRQNRLTLDEAVRAKYRHEDRHNDTDEFRQWVFSKLRDELTIDDHESNDATQAIRSFAARVAKGQTAFAARANCGPNDGAHIGNAVLDPIPDTLCYTIEEKREELLDGSQFATETSPPVSEGETYEVEIIGTGKKGDGIAKLDGYVLVVPNASVGQTVTVEIKTATPNVAFTQIVGSKLTT